MNEVEPILVIFEDRKEKEQVVYIVMMLLVDSEEKEGVEVGVRGEGGKEGEGGECHDAAGRLWWLQANGSLLASPTKVQVLLSREKTKILLQ